jgi:EAL domain-containing protein (putative c-di-GMP-specific phosphodiesterase class I)
LELEITESIFIGNVERTLATLHSLRSLGVRVALDDFGTGYSSLRYLRQFPVSMLKIDRSFVSGLGQSYDDKVIVETILRMAASLGIQVVAEGVETEEQRVILSRLGCEFLQGYLLGQPLDSPMSDQFLARSERRRKWLRQPIV